MKKMEKIAHENGLFLILNVGMCLGMRRFAGEVLESFSEKMAQFPTDSAGAPGYIRVDSSAIKEKGYGSWDNFEEREMGGLFEKASYGFSSRTVFEGDLNEKIVIKRDGYEFLFHIREYERDSAHEFEIIKPEELDSVPEGEVLGRVAYLTIKPEAT
ncbi:MAG TPA: hypothetical protein DCX32_04135 [Candidatus Moranbacteria bacterium]|nr:MAG: hypothetical protein UW87_C0028G0016 [Candidatus Moranbacteria bacterium GW2011_GWC2_45_10]KKT93073.1 MAG: hypothetical protein UW95_C0026G0014 [Parcubacteria group bacterium GW2011_GWC1_45_14]HAV11696.1 hypothetical protein [Candidatus Moranbacteria bacterium]